jgi:hypothetical protein
MKQPRRQSDTTCQREAKAGTIVHKRRVEAKDVLALFAVSIAQRIIYEQSLKEPVFTLDSGGFVHRRMDYGTQERILTKSLTQWGLDNNILT